jgi:hypothetical protein
LLFFIRIVPSHEQTTAVLPSFEALDDIHEDETHLASGDTFDNPPSAEITFSTFDWLSSRTDSSIFTVSSGRKTHLAIAETRSKANQ